MDYQKIILVGNATDAARFGRPKDKTPYADSTVAVNRSRDEADFFPVRVFGKMADWATKGVPCARKSQRLDSA